MKLTVDLSNKKDCHAAMEILSGLYGTGTPTKAVDPKPEPKKADPKPEPKVEATPEPETTELVIQDVKDCVREILSGVLDHEKKIALRDEIVAKLKEDFGVGSTNDLKEDQFEAAIVMFKTFA